VCTSQFLVHVDLKIATTKIETFTDMVLKSAKLKMVIKVPAFETLEKGSSCAKFSFQPSLGQRS
jgi:hypothetical protein